MYSLSVSLGWAASLPPPRHLRRERGPQRPGPPRPARGAAPRCAAGVGGGGAGLTAPSRRRQVGGEAGLRDAAGGAPEAQRPRDRAAARSLRDAAAGDGHAGGGEAAPPSPPAFPTGRARDARPERPWAAVCLGPARLGVGAFHYLNSDTAGPGLPCVARGSGRATVEEQGLVLQKALRHGWRSHSTREPSHPCPSQRQTQKHPRRPAPHHPVRR